MSRTGYSEKHQERLERLEGLGKGLEDLRETGLEFFANSLESYYRACRELARAAQDERGSEPNIGGIMIATDERSAAGGQDGAAEHAHHQTGAFCEGESRPDFLYDFTRLNLDYINQVARLSSGYATLPARFLEWFYSQTEPRNSKAARSPKARERPNNSLLQEILPGGSASFEFQIRNCSGRTDTARLCLLPFKDGRGQDVEGLSARLKCRNAEHEDELLQDVDPGVNLTVQVNVQATEKLESQRRFTARVDVIQGTGSGSIMLELHSK